ncbi:MAG: hypothetical protein LLG00_03025 [Planctomycetaceae bacterium]|nr:hypothetical protein [Planctomycetaceae bacterium]
MAFHRALLLALLLIVSAPSLAAPLPFSPVEKQPWIGKKVDIQLRTGKALRGVVIEEAVPGKIPGTFVRVRVSDPASNSTPTLGAMAIRYVATTDGNRLLAFDEATKCLASTDADSLDAIHRAAAAARPATSSAASPKVAKSHSARTAKRTGDSSSSASNDAERHKQNEDKRLAFFKKTGVWLWPELTADEQKAALGKQREFIRNVSEAFPSLEMHLYETQYFLFFSDLAPQPASLYTACLDEMHSQLCKAFAIKDRDRVWLGGKMPVIAFSQGQQFAAFEQQFFKADIDAGRTQGLSHQGSNGEVIVSCHAGNNPYYFASVLVHETTHGFIHRYKSSQLVPNWLNEGIAEWVAMNVVAKDQGVKRKVRDAMLRLRQTPSLGGDFFTTEHLVANQYGIATAMVEYLLRANPKGFRAMIESIKLGEDWQTALNQSYRVTPEQLTQQFGIAVVGVRNLRP